MNTFIAVMSVLVAGCIAVTVLAVGGYLRKATPSSPPAPPVPSVSPCLSLGTTVYNSPLPAVGEALIAGTANLNEVAVVLPASIDFFVRLTDPNAQNGYVVSKYRIEEQAAWCTLSFSGIYTAYYTGGNLLRGYIGSVAFPTSQAVVPLSLPGLVGGQFDHCANEAGQPCNETVLAVWTTATISFYGVMNNVFVKKYDLAISGVVSVSMSQNTMCVQTSSSSTVVLQRLGPSTQFSVSFQIPGTVASSAGYDNAVAVTNGTTVHVVSAKTQQSMASIDVLGASRVFMFRSSICFIVSGGTLSEWEIIKSPESSPLTVIYTDVGQRVLVGVPLSSFGIVYLATTNVASTEVLSFISPCK
jgi:hypothetical protein